MGGRSSAEALHQPGGRITVACCAEPKYDLTLLPCSELKRDLHRGARIQASAGLTGQSRPVHRAGIAERAVGTDKLGEGAADGSNGIVDVKESDPVRKFAVVRVASIKATGSHIDPGRAVR